MCCGGRTGETCCCYGSGWTKSAGGERVLGRRVAMSLISLLLNLLWIFFGGLWMALAMADREGDRTGAERVAPLGATRVDAPDAAAGSSERPGGRIVNRLVVVER